MSDKFITWLKSASQSDLVERRLENLMTEIGPLTKGLTIQAPQFQPDLMLFRGRSEARCTHVKDLTYPPPDTVRLGRANAPRSPKFYATTHRHAVFYEVPNKVGDTLLVSRWRTTKPLLVNHLGYVDTVFGEMGSARKKAGWDGKSDPLSAHAPSRTALEIVGRLFAEQGKSKYPLTAALAEFWMRGLPNGIIYPAIAMKANADNFALKPAWVDSGLEFVGVERVRVDAIRGFERDVTVLDYATADADGVLDWKGRPPNWTLMTQDEQLSFSTEGGVWVARDEAGNIRDPS